MDTRTGSKLRAGRSNGKVLTKIQPKNNFHVDFDVLLLSTEFKTQPLGTQCYWLLNYGIATPESLQNQYMKLPWTIRGFV